MSRKQIIFIWTYVFFILSIIWLNWEEQQFHIQTAEGMEEEVIPEEAIRLRILANSNSPRDQIIKREVRDQVNQKVSNIAGQLHDKNEAKQAIQAHMSELEKIVESALEKKGVSQSYSLELKKGVEFPTRVYGPLVYPAGEYEALLITLGDGEGQNWWCVLFPPLCFVDFSSENNDEQVEEVSSTEKDEEKNEKEVAFFLVEKWKSWFGS